MSMTISGKIAPAQPGAVCWYDDVTKPRAIPEHLMAPGALVAIGRRPGAVTNAAAAAKAGALVALYIDATMFNPFGEVHAKLYAAGTLYGQSYPALKAYPQGGTQWGPPVDFTQAAMTAEKYRAVLRWVAETYPYVRVIFCDDQGTDWMGYNTRPWSQAIAAGSQRALNAAEQLQARDYQLALAQAARDAADEYGWLLLTNGEWRADTTHGYAGGKWLAEPGCDLYDGFVCEHHDYATEAPFWRAVLAGHWRGRDAAGQRPNLVIASSSADAAKWAAEPNVAWVTDQTTPQYDWPPASSVVFSMPTHDLLLGGPTPAPPPSTGGRDTTPPVTDPPPDPCADVRAELAAANARADQAVLDAREANAALDTANGLLDAAHGMLDAGRDLLAVTRADLDKIRGSAATIATRGKVIPADVGRATGIQTAAERAIARIDAAAAAS